MKGWITGLLFATLLGSGSAWAGGQKDVLVSTTAELVAAMNPQNAGKTIRVAPGVYCPNAPLVLPEGSRVIGAGKMEYENGLPTGFRQGTETRIVPAGDPELCPGEPGLFAGTSIVTLTDGSSLQGVWINFNTSLPAYTFRANTVIAHAKGGQTIRTAISECDIQARSFFASIPPGIPTGRALMFFTGDGPPNNDLPGDPLIQAAVSRSIIRGNNTVSLFTGQFESNGDIFLALQGNVFIEGLFSLDLVGGISRRTTLQPGQFVDYVPEDTTTEVLSIGNFYQGNGAATSSGWGITAGANGPMPNAPASNRHSMTITSLNDRIENSQNGVNVQGAYRRTQGHGTLDGNSVDLQLIGTQISTLADLQGSDLKFCPIQTNPPPGTPKVDKVGDGNWIHVSAIGLNGSGERNNHYGYSPERCGVIDDIGADNGLVVWGNLKLWNVLNKNIDPDPPAELFSF